MMAKQAPRSSTTPRRHVPVRVARQRLLQGHELEEQSILKVRENILRPVEPVAPVETVASLLAASRAAHARYRQLDAQTPSHASPAMHEAVREAMRLRQAAHAQDPQQTDPAWVEDMTTNRGARSDHLMVFYAHYLTPLQSVTRN